MAVMIDLETIDSDPDTSVILTIGMVRFDQKAYSDNKPIYDDSILIKLDVEEQIEMGRTISDSTIEWWSRQPEESKNEAFGDEGRVTVTEALSQITKFCWNQKAIWSNGINFDISNVNHLFKAKKMRAPWEFYHINDARTLYNNVGQHMNPPMTPRNNNHSAVDDCLEQIRCLQAIFERLRA
jgi:hypothetical protein